MIRPILTGKSEQTFASRRTEKHAVRRQKRAGFKTAAACKKTQKMQVADHELAFLQSDLKKTHGKNNRAASRSLPPLGEKPDLYLLAAALLFLSAARSAMTAPMPRKNSAIHTKRLLLSPVEGSSGVMGVSLPSYTMTKSEK